MLYNVIQIQCLLLLGDFRIKYNIPSILNYNDLLKMMILI